VIPTTAENRILGQLGPDVLGPDWDAAEATRRLLARPDREVGEALIDQSVMAGPGNVYRSEACFLAGIDPRTAVAAVEDPTGLVALMEDLMRRNRSGGRRVTTGDPRRGHELWVYGRRGRPCRRCGTSIRSFLQGSGAEARIAFACPSCQPEADVRGTEG
jgi:endonuclease VIII